MELISLERVDGVAIMKMNGGENRLNPDFIKAFAKALSQVENDASANSLVLTSSDPKNWILGIDLEWYNDCRNNRNSGELIRFHEKLDKILKSMLHFPVPIVAAITGHCYGSGAVLAAACDFRFMRADWGLFCLPQVDLGIQLSPGLAALLSHKFPGPNVEGLLLTGKRLTALELEQHLLIIKQCRDADTTLKESMAFARGLNKDRKTYQEIKQMLNAPIIQVMEHRNHEFYQSYFSAF